MLKQLKVRVLAQNRDRKLLRLHQHIVGKIGLVHSERNPIRLARDLDRRICNAAIELRCFRRQNKKSVGQLEHGFGIHRFPPVYDISLLTDGRARSE